MGSRIIIFDCNGDARPSICFNLEVARCEPRIVSNEKEALNLMKISQHTGEVYDCLLVNNPYLNADITWLVEQWQILEIDKPIVFVKQSEPLKKIVMSLSQNFPKMNIFFTEPKHVADFVRNLTEKKQIYNKA
jgi:hypothetical protein